MRRLRSPRTAPLLAAMGSLARPALAMTTGTARAQVIDIDLSPTAGTMIDTAAGHTLLLRARFNCSNDQLSTGIEGSAKVYRRCGQVLSADGHITGDGIPFTFAGN